MSQQTNFDEEQRGYQGTYSPPPNPQRGYYQYYEPGGQKLGQTHVERSPSAGQRLALAIVSVIALIPLLGILSTTQPYGPGGYFLDPARLIVMVVACLTIVAINIVFNRR